MKFLNIEFNVLGNVSKDDLDKTLNDATVGCLQYNITSNMTNKWRLTCYKETTQFRFYYDMSDREAHYCLANEDINWEKCDINNIYWFPSKEQYNIILKQKTKTKQL
jgi:hypothetical protein